MTTSSREEQLAQAREVETLAKSYLSQMDNLKSSIIESFPTSPTGLPRCKYSKATSFEKLWGMLIVNASAVARLEAEFADEDYLHKVEQSRLTEADQQHKSVEWLIKHRPELKFGKDYTLDTAVKIAGECI